MGNMRDIVASIHPRHAQAILNGTKTIELRRKLPKRSVGLMYIYETAPTSMVIGAVQVMAVDERQKGEMWAVHGPWSGVTETEFYDYFDGAALAGGLVLRYPDNFKAAYPITDLGLTRPPQSWCYVPEVGS